MSGFIGRFLTAGAQQIILRFMGLILVAIASDMMLTGFQQSLGSGVQSVVPEIVDEVKESLDTGSAATPSPSIAPATSPPSTGS